MKQWQGPSIMITIQQLVDAHKKKPITLVKIYIKEFLKNWTPFRIERDKKIHESVIGIDYH